MRTGWRSSIAGVLLAMLVTATAHAKIAVDFLTFSAEHEHAAQEYRAIWDAYGERIVDAMEARTCMAFSEPFVLAVVEEATSHSGGPQHPMRLRASYDLDTKKSTLVHELGHRHLWQLAERLEYLDGHMTLYLILDRVWADVWGEDFAAQRVIGEATWTARYDYGSAWLWARSLLPQERNRLWNELLAMNGFTQSCAGPIPGVG